MAMSHYPNGFKGGVSIRGVPVLSSFPGNVFWVDSNRGTNGDGSFQQAYTSIALALARCVDDNGDIIVCKAKHAETISAAAGLTIATKGVALIGLGQGADRPTLTFGTDVAASLLISAASCSFENFVCISAIDQLTHPIDLTANDTYLDFEWRDASTVLEAVTVIRAVAIARLNVKIRHHGQTAGSHAVAIASLNGCSGTNIDLDAYGKYSTAAVNFVTTACTNVKVTGNVYNSGTTDGSKLVVDTITGSTWYAVIADGAAGGTFSGGSGAALASDDISTVASNQTVAPADAGTNAQQRDVTGNKTDAAVLVVGTTKSIIAYVKGILTYLLVGTANGAANASAADVTGNKTDTAVYTIGTTNSLVALAKGILDSAPRTTKSGPVVMVNGNTIFTIAGGPIELEALWSECVTGNDATASTVQYQAVPTAGNAQTISAASASIANAAAGASVSLIGTALATAALYNANGPNLGMSPPGGIIAPAGTLKVVIGVGSTTGTWRHYIRYRPLSAGVTVI